MCGLGEAVAEAWYGVQSSSVKRALTIIDLNRTVCHNGQSAALLSSSGLVMYFCTLPAPSSSVPCILTILTHLRVCVKICILTHPLFLAWGMFPSSLKRESREININ